MNSAMRAAATYRERDYRHEALMNALEALFRPLARVLVDQGVSSPEAESLLRAVCVHEVADAQERPNASRIAFLTGLDRKEVSRILKHPPRANPALEGRCHLANKVLAGWHTDRAFVHDGRPLLLPIKARERKRPSFWMLARRYAPDVYPGLILRELSRVGALERLHDGRVRPRMRRYRVKSQMRFRLQDLLRGSGLGFSLRK